MTKVSLFKELKSGGYDSSLITTFNVYFPFYEEVLLRRMRSCGVQQNAVLIDSGMCQEAMEDAYPLMAGRHYTLAPMACPKAFHPKIVLLLGKRKGLLAVGSHNLTFSGYGFNAELTNVIRYRADSDDETVSLFWAAWQAVQTWIDDYGSKLPNATKKALNAIVDGIDWLKPTEMSEEQNIHLFYSSRSTESLWDQVEPWIPEKPQQCQILGAFFDSRLDFVRQVQEDVSPAKMFVGIQPSTVQGPNALLSLKGVSTVNSEAMLSDTDNHKYIHAKAIYIQDRVNPVLVVGSANPSSSAWLRKGDACNAEVVLVRMDKGVKSAATDLGFHLLTKAPEVDSITAKRAFANESSANPDSVLVTSYLLGSQLVVDWNCVHKQTVICLENSSGEILEEILLKRGRSQHGIQIDASLRSELATASIWEANDRVARVLLFYADEIESITAKGTRKKFRDALGSLNTDSPELKILFNCLDKIIFDSKDKLLKTVSQRSSHNIKEKENEGASLVVEWSGVSANIKGKSKRLRASDDLTSLLDAFVYGLGSEVVETSAFSAEDKFGRNEEELVGSDDEDDDNEGYLEETLPAGNEMSDDEKIALCHRRIKTITNKICNSLDLLGKKKLTHLELLPTLLAVVSLLKELNQRSRQFDWIHKEFQILPSETIVKLFAKICEYWWGSNYGLLHQKDGDISIIDEVDELVRLRGLLVWLAWYVDIVYEPRVPFGEERDKRDSRLWMNSVYILLAQMTASDEMIEEEAARICASENKDCLKWFSELVKFGQYLNDSYRKARSNKGLLSQPCDGCWVLHKNEAFVGLRYCYSADGNSVKMPSVSKEGEYRIFTPEMLLAYTGN